MKSIRPSSLILAACLAALAGYVDALGFLHLGGYFVSFMSGNSTRLAIHAAEGDAAALAVLAPILGGFILGAMLGTLAGHAARQRRRPAILAGVGGLLLIASLVSESGAPVHAALAMAIAMGAVNAIFQRDGKVVVAVTYMTGALVLIGQRIADALLGRERFGWLPPLLLWCGLVSGGLAGTLVHARIGLHGLWLAAAAAFCLALASLGHRHGEDGHI